MKISRFTVLLKLEQFFWHQDTMDDIWLHAHTHITEGTISSPLANSCNSTKGTVFACGVNYNIPILSWECNFFHQGDMEKFSSQRNGIVMQIRAQNDDGPLTSAAAHQKVSLLHYPWEATVLCRRKRWCHMRWRSELSWSLHCEGS